MSAIAMKESVSSAELKLLHSLYLTLEIDLGKEDPLVRLLKAAFLSAKPREVEVALCAWEGQPIDFRTETIARLAKHAAPLLSVDAKFSLMELQRQAPFWANRIVPVDVGYFCEDVENLWLALPAKDREGSSPPFGRNGLVELVHLGLVTLVASIEFDSTQDTFGLSIGPYIKVPDEMTPMSR